VLVGLQDGGLIRASYGFGVLDGELPLTTFGVHPTLAMAAQLTLNNAGTAWNSADSNTLGAWDFGTDAQIPALKYADYDGGGAVFNCDQFPARHPRESGGCGTLLPGQDDASAGGPPAVEFGGTVTLVGSLKFSRVNILSWSWRQLEGPTVTLSAANARDTTFTAPESSAFLVFELTATDSGGRRYSDRIGLAVVEEFADRDGDGLIEIDSLIKLHNMRHNPAGRSYMTSTTSVGNGFGCPAGRCFGYELTRDLDFDGDNDGSTWSRNNDGSYTLDGGDHNDDYFPVDADGTGGWLPIGGGNNPFAAVFDGNGHTISNLAIRRDQTYVGLFGAIGADAAIRNLGLIDNLADYTGSGRRIDHGELREGPRRRRQRRL
jgi:hypothetical protein